MEKVLFIPPSKKVTGLKVYCRVCSTNVGATCKKNGKIIQKCPHPEALHFKIYAHEPGTKNVRRTKNLGTRALEEARFEALQFRKEVKSIGNKDKTVIESSNEKPQTANSSFLLSHALAKHVSWLGGNNVPAHRKKFRSQSHLNDIERAYRVFIKCLDENGRDTTKLTVHELNDDAVGEVYDYLLKNKKFSNRSFNKYIGYFTSFIKWYSEEFDIPIKNWFEKVERKKVVYNPEAITKKEFDDLLEQLSKANGKLKYPHEDDARYLYRSYLRPAFLFALHSGRRREEVIQAKFSDIIEESDGSACIKIADIKVNRIKGSSSEAEKKYIYVPVTRALRELLNETGYEKYKGTDRFLIGPEIERDRNRVMSDNLSRAFSHYFNQVSDRKLTFKSLRKTYVTAAHIFTGGNAKALSGHSGNAVVEKNYLAQKVLAQAAVNFEVFPAEMERKDELEKLREDSKQNKIEIEK